MRFHRIALAVGLTALTSLASAQVARQTYIVQLADAPAAAYDYRRHSILSSLIELYGPALPRTH